MLVYDDHDIHEVKTVYSHIFFQSRIGVELIFVDFHILEEKGLHLLFYFRSCHVILLLFACFTYDNGVSLPQMVMYLLYLHAGLTKTIGHILGVVHLRIAVGDGGEI